MGCTSSKEMKDSPAAAFAGTAVEKVTGALDALNNNRTSVIDQINLAKQMVATAASNTINKARGMQNIFAAPLEFMDTFQAPDYPKTEEEKAFIEKAILQNFVFANMSPSSLRTMIRAFERVTFEKNTKIIKQGDTGDYFYVIQVGQVGFLVNDKPVGEPAGPGQTFGELSLLYSAPRAATCIAQASRNVLYRVDQTTFRYILHMQTHQADKVKRELLQNVSFLKELDGVDLGKLADNMTPRPFQKGDVIVKKGDDGDAFYIIQEGTVLVQDIEVGGKVFEDMQLGPGEFFGERALVTKEPRTANCIAATSGIALYVDSDTFTKVMGNLSALVLKASDKRVLEALKAFQHTALEDTSYTSLAELIVDKSFKKGQILFQEGTGTIATLYIVREGQIRLTSSAHTEYKDVIIKQGGLFGEEMLERDAQRGANPSAEPLYNAKYTATVIEDCVLGCLTLTECRTVMDTTSIGKSTRSARFQSIKNEDIPMSALTRHAILGAGTFGQVWLVSRVTSDGHRKAYALKIQSKYELVRNSQARGVVQEKNIMAQLRHPFIINLVTTYADKQRVYMLLELVQGGELFSLLHRSNSDCIPEVEAKFYASAILEGLGYMHRRSILYRDLKPENVLIDNTGYPVIVDLGFAKYVKDKTYTLCGTPLYIAPEVVLNRGHDMGADHWSLACMIYEMICGATPFYKDGMDQLSLFRAVVKGHFKFPKSRKEIFSEASKDLITRMLVVDPHQRLGSLAGGEKDIFRAAWFDEINFDKLKRKEIPAPWVPKIKDPLDTSNFENWDHLDDKAKARDPPISPKDEEIFRNF